MAYWLLKTEPGTYSFAKLASEKRAVWDGVSNPVALKNIRAMAKGDQAFIYHTGSERAVVGTASVEGAPYPDPKAGDPKLVVVDLKAGKALARPVTLDEMKRVPALAGWDLLRLGRLSVVPVTEGQWRTVMELARSADASTTKR